MKLLHCGRVACVCLPLCTLPITVQAQDFIYTTNNGTITITRYTGSGGAVTIPSTITGLTVTSINGAFAHHGNVTSVTIPDSVTNIGDHAFDFLGSRTELTKVTMGKNVIRIGQFAFLACDKLASITIPKSVTSIGNGAFTFCTSLTSVTIPSSVTSIGDRAFNACFSLKEIRVEKNNTAYSSVDGVLFNRSLDTLIQYPGGKAGSYAIPNTVTNIGHLALWNCPHLTSVTIPNGITSIEREAFAACSSLTNATIPASVTNIGDNAFDSCESLTGIYFHGNAPTLGGPVIRADNAIIYYLPGALGWGTTFGGRPTALW